MTFLACAWPLLSTNLAAYPPPYTFYTQISFLLTLGKVRKTLTQSMVTHRLPPKGIKMGCAFSLTHWGLAHVIIHCFKIKSAEGECVSLSKVRDESTVPLTRRWALPRQQGDSWDNQQPTVSSPCDTGDNGRVTWAPRLLITQCVRRLGPRAAAREATVQTTTDEQPEPVVTEEQPNRTPTGYLLRLPQRRWWTGCRCWSAPGRHRTSCPGRCLASSISWFSYLPAKP